MTILDQFPTYEQCCELKALGLTQNTAFVFVSTNGSDEEPVTQHIAFNDEFAYEMASLNPVAAPSVAELGVILMQHNEPQSYFSHYTGEDYQMWEDTDGVYDNGMLVYAPTEARVRAYWLLCLLKTGKLTIAVANQRLVDTLPKG